MSAKNLCIPPAHTFAFTQNSPITIFWKNEVEVVAMRGKQQPKVETVIRHSNALQQMEMTAQ